MNGRVVLAGGSGFLGRALSGALLRQGFEVVILTRRPASVVVPGVREVEWDGIGQGSWSETLDGAAAVVNLTGRSVNCRHTPANRREILESRVKSVAAVGEAIRRSHQPPGVWIQAGSLAYYRDAGDRWCDETSAAGTDFPARVCVAWEDAFEAEATPATRKVLFRIGLVLAPEDGFLKTLAGLARWGLGGHAGNGRQYISWLHIEEMNRMLLWALEREDLRGVYNATGPNPVPNAEFMRQLRRVLRRPWSPPVPEWAVRLGGWMMDTEGILALTSRRCAPAGLSSLGFWFVWPELSQALDDLYNNRKL